MRAALAAALDEADLILISGGSSVGVRDLTLTAIQDLPGAEVLVHGVAIRPGKPTILAAVGETGTKPLLGLPGHPASAAVVMEVLGRPLLQHLAGLKRPGPLGPHRHRGAVPQPGRGHAAGKTTSGCACAGRAITLWADPVLGPSGLLSPLVQSDGLVMIPLGVEGLFKGEPVEVRLFGG